MRLLGLDGCKNSSWVVAEADSSFTSIRFSVTANLTPVVGAATDSSAVAVADVPIGLSHEDRPCDKAARTLLGKCASRVFRPPCREALTAATFEQANEVNKRLCGVGLSQQAFNIRERIKAVDDLITPALQQQIREGHPEVVFANLNGGTPIVESKNSREGADRRLRILAACGVPQFDPVAERARLGKNVVDVDDIIDAVAMLLTAKHVSERTAVSLPEGEGTRDHRGLLMEMWTPPVRPKGLTKATPDSPALFDAWINPLTFLDAENPETLNAEAVLRFLCTPGTDWDVAAVASRYRQIDDTEVRLFFAPAEQQILKKLIWPLREAKAAYMIGSYLGTVALCGMVAEMVAVLAFNITKVRLNDRPMTEQDQEALFGRHFERLGQERRVRVLGAYGLIADEQRKAFDAIRVARNRYLHHWSATHDDLAETARSAYGAALKLVVWVIGQQFRDGAVLLNPKLVEYLRELGALRPRVAKPE